MDALDQKSMQSSADVTDHLKDSLDLISSHTKQAGTSVVVDQDLEGPPTLISSEMQESGTSVATDLEGPFPSFSPDMAAEVLSYLRARGLSDEITISIANGFLQQILTSGFVLNFTLLVC